MYRYLALLTTLLASGIVAVAFGAPVAPARSQASTAATQPITPARLRELRARAMLRPQPVVISEGVSVPLGLTEPGVPYLTKQASFGTRKPPDKHYFAFPISGSGSALAFHSVELAGFSGTEMFVIDEGGQLIKAALINNGQFRLLSLEVARPAFESEMRRWAIVERFFPLPNAPVLPPANP